MFERADAFRGFAGRHRHARGAGRAAHLGAARPPQEADPDRQHQRLLGPLLDADRAHARAAKFVPPALSVDFLVAKRVEDILPKLQEAARRVPPRADKAMTVAGRAGCEAASSSATSPSQKRHRLDAVAVAVADEGGVIAREYCGRMPGAPSDLAPAGDRSGMERIDRLASGARRQICGAAVGGLRLIAAAARLSQNSG